MGEAEEDADSLQGNITNFNRSRTLSREDTNGTEPTKIPFFYIPKRPQVVKMRDLSPDTKSRLHREYYEVYDPWTGIRIAATLGILISLFTLFLIYKGRYNRAKNNIVASKKPSLYLYDEDLDCDLGNVGSSDDTGSFAYSFRFDEDRLPREYRFGLGNEEFPLEEVLVKSSMVECVALTVHKSQKGSKGPKYGTLRIKDDTSRSLPCSPYNGKKTKTNVEPTEVEDPECTTAKSPYSPTPPEVCSSTFGSVTSFSSTDSSDGLVKTTVFSKSKTKGATGETIVAKKPKKTEASVSKVQEDINLAATSAVVLSTRKPQDYRSRSTVVTIGRRKKKT